MSPEEKPVLVAGATGYVGGRLVPRLLESGRRVRVMGRSFAKLSCRPWSGHPLLETAKADVLDLDSLYRAAKGCGSAYYLVHSMSKGVADFAATDRRAALNMAAACGAAGLSQIIYLGGMVPDDPRISHHLRSRAEVGRILSSGQTPCTWLKAAMILGSGSASFELLRYLADRLPVMITPRWVHTPCQPIAIENVLGYLVGCLGNPKALGRAFDIGGPQITTYAGLFRTYSRIAGLPPRVIVPVPVLSPALSSYWVHLVTPVPASLARPLTEGLRNPVVAADDAITEVVPQRLMTPAECISRALDRVARAKVETCWMDAGNPLPPEWRYCADAPYSGGAEYTMAFRAVVNASPEEAWPAIGRVGGKTGWHHADWLWRLRGFLDRLAGGVGMRSGRRHPEELASGDALDFWRVLKAEKPRRLLLLAEMKNPGQAVLELRAEPAGARMCELQLIARFMPRGLAGMLYWFGLHPVHGWLFGGMLKGMAKSLGRPLVMKPHRFDPDRDGACPLPPDHGKAAR